MCSGPGSSKCCPWLPPRNPEGPPGYFILCSSPSGLYYRDHNHISAQLRSHLSSSYRFALVLIFAVMDIPLKALLEKNQIHQDVMTKFTDEGCDTVELFSEWSYTDVEMIAALLTPTSQKDSASQRARLKLAWKTAKAMCDKKIKRIVEGGVADEDPDEPLDPGVQNSLEEAWSKAWSWPRLPAHLMAADEILGQVAPRVPPAQTHPLHHLQAPHHCVHP